MMNYNSAVSILTRAGFGITNKCRFEGETFHDFQSSKKKVSVSLVIDDATGSVSRAEVTSYKWSDNTHRYEPVNETINGLQQLMDRFAPRTPMSL